MEISNIILAVAVVLLLQSCSTKYQSKENLLKGEWKGNHIEDTVLLKFSDKKLDITFSWADTSSIVNWKFRLNGDTLTLLSEKIGEEKHIVTELTQDILRLKPYKTNQVDIPIIDIITFKKEN